MIPFTVISQSGIKRQYAFKKNYKNATKGLYILLTLKAFNSKVVMFTPTGDSTKQPNGKQIRLAAEPNSLLEDLVA